MSHLESHVLPDFNQQPQDEIPSARGAEPSHADDPNVPSEAGPSADDCAPASSAAPLTSTPLETSQVGDEKSPFGNETDSSSDGISHLESFTLPDFTKMATLPPTSGAAEAPVGATPRQEDASEAKEDAAHDDNDKEYMRRCKSMFMQYAQEHGMDDAMEKYDEFLSRPRDDVLAEPAHMFPTVQEAGDENPEAEEAPAVEQKEEAPPAVESDASTSEAEPEPDAALGTPAQATPPATPSESKQPSEGRKGSPVMTYDSDSSSDMSGVNQSELLRVMENVHGGYDSGMD